jgi:hypothetical protein
LRLTGSSTDPAPGTPFAVFKSLKAGDFVFRFIVELKLVGFPSRSTCSNRANKTQGKNKSTVQRISFCGPFPRTRTGSSVI